jgi:hypothetical protein
MIGPILSKPGLPKEGDTGFKILTDLMILFHFFWILFLDLWSLWGIRSKTILTFHLFGHAFRPWPFSGESLNSNYVVLFNVEKTTYLRYPTEYIKNKNRFINLSLFQ